MKIEAESFSTDLFTFRLLTSGMTPCFKGLWAFGKAKQVFLVKSFVLLLLIFGVEWMGFQTNKTLLHPVMKEILTSKMCSRFQEYCTHSITEGRHDVAHYSAPSHRVFLAFVT